jgi:hypothetical protein
MKREAFLVLIIIVTLYFCKNKNSEAVAGFKKQNDGLEYKMLSEGAGGTPNQGDYIKMNVRQVYNDSLLSDTRNMLPQYQKFDSVEMSKESYNIFSKVHVGDSLVFKVPSDSAFKTSKPAFAKKKGWLYTYVKIEGIMNETEAQADLDMEKAKRKN